MKEEKTHEEKLLNLSGLRSEIQRHEEELESIVDKLHEKDKQLREKLSQDPELLELKKQHEEVEQKHREAIVMFSSSIDKLISSVEVTNEQPKEQE